jgi:nucleoside-diphosphate-sugar epimerase
MKQILGFECRTTLRDGLRKTIDWFLANRDTARLSG